MFVSEGLSDQHDLESFDSGNPALDDWLRTAARRAQRAGTAHVTVWHRAGSPVVEAYYAIAPTAVAAEGLSRSARGGFSGSIPGYLIAKLALSRNLHGAGHGGQLLLDALETVAAAANLASGRLVVVDAIDEGAHAFYRRQGLQPIGGTMRLVARIDNVVASLAQAQYGAPEEQLRALAARFRWATTGAPEFPLFIQIEPVAHQPRLTTSPIDAVLQVFGGVGFTAITHPSDALSPASPEIHLRIDSDTRATVSVRNGADGTIDVPIPHNRPDLTQELISVGSARIYVTTDSIGSNGLVDEAMLAHDVETGSVLAARIRVAHDAIR